MRSRILLPFFFISVVVGQPTMTIATTLEIPPEVSTLAGKVGENPGTTNGTGTEARFNYPRDVAVDGSGNVYVADTYNNLIRKITSGGVVTTLAGSGSPGSANGTGTEASFYYPWGVAVDGSGNVYVIDYENYLIRKITPAGVVTTLAGSGSAGSVNGTGTGASFSYSYGIAVDGSGNVYVADSDNHLIRKITSGGVVTTLAGNSGSAGSANGTGTAASFSRPTDVAVDGNGNVYVADPGNQVIRKITSAGVVTTLAGSDRLAGSANGTGTAASFNAPVGVAVDGSGNVYVADRDNHLIRKITSAGVVTTLAGTGSLGSANGTGTAASFNQPSGVAVDGSGNVYVGDPWSRMIRKISTTLASGSTTNDATFPLIFTASKPTTDFAVGDITVTNGALSNFAAISSAVYTATFTPSASGATTIDVAASKFTDAAGNNNTAATQFNWTYDGNAPSVTSVTSTKTNGSYPVGATIPITITFNQTVTVTGTPQLTLETGATDAVVDYASGTSTATLTFNYVVAAGENSSDLDYISAAALTLNSGTIKDASGNVATLTLPTPGASGSLGANKAIVIDGNAPSVTSVTSTKTNGSYPVGATIPITITFNQTVTVTGTPQLTLETGATDAVVDYASGTGTATLTFNYVVAAGHASSDLDYASAKPAEVTTLAGSGSSGSANGTGTAASFYYPSGVAVDGSGNVYVADRRNHLIRKITSAGEVTTLAGSGSAGSVNGTGTGASFSYSYGIAVDGSGNVYVADSDNNLIRKITPAGVVTTLAGSGSGGSANGTGTAASFLYPEGVAVDGSGNVYVGGGVNHLVRKITSAGVVTTLAGSGYGSEGSANGTGTAASFNYPSGVAVDGSGNVYVADRVNHLIRKITSAGVVTTLAGSGSEGSADGTGTAASFNGPSGVALDGSGNVYVVDRKNHLIRKITSAGVVTTLAGSGSPGSANGTGTEASFYYPWGVAVDGSGNVYVADATNHLIRKITTTHALALNSGTIKDPSGNAATLTLPSPGATNSLGANKALIIDTTSPTVSTVSSSKNDAAYKVGESIPINMNFDDKVYVTGTPQLTLETGTTDAVVDYSSGSESTTLTFNYTVASTHNSSDLDYTSTSALALNSGTVKDSLGNAATLTLPAPAATGSLGANKAIIIDNLPPTLTLDPADGSTTVLPTLPISINFNEYVRLSDNTEVTSSNVDALITLKDTDVNGTDISFDATINSTKTVITIDPTADFASEQTVYVAISASLEDTLDHATSAASATLKMKDVIVPTVTFDPTNGSSDVPGNRNITLTFNESIRNIDNSEITDANVADLVDLKGNNASGADFNFGATINTDKTVITVDPLFDFSASSVVYVGIGAVVEDDADNAIVASSALYITGIPDVIGPAVSNVTSANADSSYKNGSSIIITISFNEVAIVTGTPQLTLETGTTDGVANYSSGSGTKDLYFTYNVTSDHNTAHLDYISSNALTKNEGTIKDFVGNSANLALPNPGAEGSLGANKTIVIDHFIPVISLVAEGTLTGEDKDFQTVATTMDISWAGTDTISGISKYEYALGTTSGGTEVKTWTDAATVTSVSLSGLSLGDGSKYYASVKATDKADNVSVVKTGDGITIDVTAPTPGTVNDGTGEDIATINSTTTLSANWTGFSDANSGIASYEYAIGTTSGGIDTKNWTSNGLETTLTLTDLTLTYTNTYFVSVRANDNAGNVSNVAISNGVVVDLYPGPPSITAASIESNSTLPVLTNTKVSFTISEPVTAATSKVTSNLGDTVSGTLSIDEPTIISMDLAAPFTSGDQITVTIDTLTDQLGNITNNLEYLYNIALIADYNVDGSIDAADLTVLLSGWTSKDYAFELGPAAGDVPNLKPATDGKYDIMDAAVLIRMWHWNLNKSGKMLSRYINLGKELVYINENNTLSIQVSKDVNAVDFYFDYPQDKVSIKQSQESSSDKEIMLSHIDTLNGKFIMTAGYLEQKLQSIEVPYIINGREDVTITAIYRMFDTNGEISSQGTKEITLKPVPQEFALHQNYPNPFNPVTTINYDLPQQTHVNLMIYDILGREVVKLVSEEIPAGYQSVIWNTRNSFGQPVSAGIYFYQIQTKGFVKTRKMVLLK